MAYLKSCLNEDIYVRPPPGFNIGDGKALYGLKQAGRCWWLNLKAILEDIGFKENEEDQSTYILNRREKKAMLWIHVDYRILASEEEDTLSFLLEQLTSRLKLRWDRELSSIIGIEIKQ
ncbi:hypothetical protein O181_055255 [Austropuccinia psidii MF-1]|uniref:Reverse transcriptase Ty1/copia-type domain-containing protein n=1 Tax=Austropuccinia psidii MF-1 TaxID=1389203 RepID=A0A9Q3EAC9_9BASI|nr:hypothetical protein [Austropuccinia psidii MF-1]